MICLRCGYCCINLCVMIVDDHEKGLKEDNIIFHSGERVSCKHLIGDKPGYYSCNIHHYKWYKKTPCYSHGQIEQSKDCNCRIGEYILKKENIKCSMNF
jgi:hypothetical protein